MKYVVLGNLSPSWASKQDKRTSNARRKLKELGIRIESMYYTQGAWDFVDVLEAPNAEAMLAFSVWYSQHGFGSLVSMPAFDERQMVTALKKSGARSKAK